MKRYMTGALGTLVTAALCLPVVAYAQVVEDFTPTKVTLDTGVLVGNMDNGVRVFRGVPYAKPPVGELRWQAPEMPDAWPGERLALADEPPCPQPVNPDGGTPNGGGVTGVQSEDCLYLTAFAPAKAEKAPVVLWMYGGAGFLGAGHLGSYNGTSNAKAGVVTFAMNYRLGALANFNHPALSKAAGKNEPLGNFALTDAVAALQWIQRNAEAFGGDPNNVTIAGQSAGGLMVVNLLSVPSAEGLYHKAVIQSGAFLQPAQSLQDAEQKGAGAMTTMGLPKDTTAEQLRAVSAQSFIYNEATRRGVGSPIDGRFRTVSTGEALDAGNEIDVPVLIGSNSGEGGFSGARDIARKTGDDGANAWLYHFAYVPSFRQKEWKNGAIHSAELMFTFDSMATSGWARSANGTVNDEDRAVAKRVHSCWVAFYKMSPSADAFTCAEGVEWPSYSESGDATMLFTREAEIVKSNTLPAGEEG
ncbi:MAG: carboxylesterase family protein [Cellvibrionaceae bacterium]